MVMVPEWMAQSIQTKFRAETSPFISGLTEIEQEMSKVLTNKKLAEDRKIMLFNQLLLRYNDIMKQKRKEEVPTIRIAKEKQKKPPSKESDFVFVTPEPKRKKKKKSPSRIPVPTYETPKRRKTLTPRRRRLEDIPEFDEDDEDDEPIVPFETPPYTSRTSPYFKKNWKRTPVSGRLSGRWEKY